MFHLLNAFYSIALSYIEGLCWVMLYYYQGCPSWNWYYPYYYAPFAADMAELEFHRPEYDPGQPFKPFEQLMSVLPPQSRHLLPSTYQPLTVDPMSPIIDFYPQKFDVDLEGKKFSWQGVVILPFIDEKRLKDALGPLDDTLTESEGRRNSRSADILYISSKSSQYHALQKSLPADKLEVRMSNCH